jgi:hypothetical protein
MGRSMEFKDDPAKILEVEIRGKKLLEFIHHAIDQMKARGMTEAEVLLTLATPDEIKDSNDMGRKSAIRKYDAANAAKVIFEELEDRWRVITVMWKKLRLSGR